MIRDDRYELDRSKRPNMWLKFDYILFVVVIALTVIGLVILPSAMLGYRPDVITRTFIVQIGGAILGAAIAIALSCVDYIVFRHIAIFFYVGNLLAMFLVYTPLGMEQFGNRNWLNLGIVTYQPSELMKLATIVMVALCLEDMKLDNGRTWYNVFRIGFFCVIPLGLVLLQGDLGTALVFLFIFVVMIFVAGIKMRYIFGTVLIGAIAFPFFWKFVLSKSPERMNRILTFINPELDPQGAGYQALWAKNAIGSGQLTGKGLGNGPVNVAGKLPVKDSDFVFSVIGEEMGFIGTVLVVGLFLIFILRMIQVSWRASDYFGQYLAIGICAMFLFHFWENIGMNIGIMPITGLPLPFISKGGSALITSFFSLGVVLSVSARRKSKGFFEEEE